MSKALEAFIEYDRFEVVEEGYSTLVIFIKNETEMYRARISGRLELGDRIVVNGCEGRIKVKLGDV